MKYIIIICDGMADRPIKELHNKTPLQTAKKPNMDYLAKNGRCGLFEPLPKGLPLGSTIANLSILGYNPSKGSLGRGYLEATSLGVNLKKNEVAFRCNFIHIKNGRIKDHSAGNISTKEARILIKYLNKKLESNRIKFCPGLSYRHVLIVKKYSPDVSCAPPHDHINERSEKLMVKAKNQKSKSTAELLNNLIIKSQKLLKDHPINIKRKEQGKSTADSVWFWDQGTKLNIKGFKEKFGIKGATISAVDLIKGLAISAGMNIINVKGATGLWNTNYRGKANAAVKALKKYDLVYLHIEAPDEASHEGNLKLKIKTIEDIDEKVIGNILKKVKKIKENITISILPDHLTPVKERKHVRGYVPFLIYNPKKKADDVAKFDEFGVKKGYYGKLKKDQFIKAVLSK